MMPCPIRVLLPPLASVDGDVQEEGDEDAWVDTDDDDIDDDDEGRDEDEEMTVVDDRDEELPTPVPWPSELLPPRTPPHSASMSTSACRPRITRARGAGGAADTRPVFV
jgi:hypothetical protein